MTTPLPVTVVIPTMGRSPCFDRCLDSLSAARVAGARVTVVADGQIEARQLPGHGIDEILMAPVGAGFAVSCNLGLASARAPFVALINDDAVLDEGWLGTLIGALEADPRTAAVQGVNLRLDEPDTVDGSGIAWNRRWQPLQIDHGAARPSFADASEIFGASATAVLYRTEALREVSLAAGEVFDPRLHTYYDDVDIASRLRSAGHGARVIPDAIAFHAGSSSSGGPSVWRLEQLTANRLLVLARLLGRAFWGRLPVALLPDLGTFSRATLRGDWAVSRGILAGWRRAAGLLRFFTHSARPLVPLTELARFRVDSSGAPTTS